MKQLLSAETIRQSYSGKRSNTACAEEKLIASDFTPSARYIIREARKRMAQHKLVGTNDLYEEEELTRFIQEIEIEEQEDLSSRERAAAVAALSASLHDFGILSSLVENEEVNDIIVRSYHDISVQLGRRNCQTDLRFPDHDSYKAFIEYLLKSVGKSCTNATPVVDATLPSQIRICVTHESFSPPGSGPMLTMRVSRHKKISLGGLSSFGLAPAEIFSYLSALVASGTSTVLISGEVATGKTTLVRALSEAIPEDQAILIIEDTQEVLLDRHFVRTLLTREANTEGAGRITPAQAIRAGMRMAMNRIILGEMRDSEAAEAFIDVCASGHAGISTIHARNSRDALSRLELFLVRAQGNVSIEAIRRQIANAVSVIVFLGLEKKEKKRRILEVFEVGSSADGFIQINPIFTFIPAKSAWIRAAGISRFTQELRDSNVVIAPPGAVVGEI